MINIHCVGTTTPGYQANIVNKYCSIIQWSYHAPLFLKEYNLMSLFSDSYSMLLPYTDSSQVLSGGLPQFDQRHV